MAKEKRYRVVWEIDIWATTPRRAAEEALLIQRDPASSATVFDVWCGSWQTHIDLIEKNRAKKARKK